ncbi:MAG TPA: hypothetical protein VLV46_07205 [Gaiellaceae bacterium]|nr:hypothetical protein [Gaiellaceae bacterium]
MGRAIVAALAAALVYAALAEAVTGGKSPRALYRALLATSIPASQLPSGYHSATVRVSSLSQNAKAHRVVGEVEVDIDSDAVIVYEVFPTRADAIADWNAARAALKKKSKSEVAAPPRFPWPAIIANSTITGKNLLGQTVTNGVTALNFTSRNVIVQAGTISTTNVDRGDVPGAIRLADFALKHLDAMRR